MSGLPGAGASVPSRLPPFARALDALHLTTGCGFLVLALAAFARGAPRSGTAVAWFAALLAATAAVAGTVHRGGAPRSAVLPALHTAWTLVLLPLVFTGLRFLVPALPAGPAQEAVGDLAVRRWDGPLAALDRDWLGVDVARWSETVLTPGLADGMMVFYAAYFLMPVVLLAALWRSGGRLGVYRPAFAVAGGLYACYGLYLLFPTCGPRHAYVLLSEPLPRGHLAGAVHDLIRDLEPQPYDAFPSAHVVLGVLCARFAWPLGGGIRWGMAVAAAGTIASTVVLRYHYVVDDLAGLAVAAAALAATGLLGRRAARKADAGPDVGHGDRMETLLGGP